MRDQYDVVVVGGGAAGLSGALTLARARRSVLVVDAGAPRNRPADGVHGLLGLEGIAPSELLDRGRREVASYGADVATDEVITARRTGNRFEVALASGHSVTARRLLVTTGLVDELPAVPGLRERWGREVVHCPYCHGWEVRDRAIGVLASGPNSVHQALLFSQWSDDVVFLAHTAPPPTDEQLQQLAARGIPVITGEVTAVELVDDRLTGVRLADGSLVERDALAVATRMVARAGFLGALGLEAVEHPSGVGEHVPAEPTGRTGVPGVWVAGNITDLSANVATSAAAGGFAAAQVNFDLVTEDIQQALTAVG